MTGDILMYYRLHTEYKAGDMVVYQADGLLHIGRIAAVPEETVQITEEGELVINGYTQADTEVFYEKRTCKWYGRTIAWKRGILYSGG